MLPPYTTLQRIRARAAAHLEKPRTEVWVFSVVFLIIAASFRPASGASSNGNVEQWMNLINSTFYGHQDFLFSYGPLFWLTGASPAPYNELAFWTSVVFVACTNALFWAVLVSACRRSRSLLYLAAAYFLVFGALQQRDVLLFLPITVVAWFDFSSRRARPLAPGVLVALGVLTGFLFYVRFVFGVVTAATFASYALYRAVTRRSVRELATLLFATLVGYVAVGLLAFHSLSSIWTYVQINEQLSTGNSVDMTLAVGESRTVIGAAIVSAVVTLTALAIKRRSLLLSSLILLVLFFKLGFSRDDHYLAYFVIPAGTIALILTFDRSRAGRAAFVAVLATLSVAAGIGTFPGAPTRNALSAMTDFSSPYPQRMQAVYPDFALRQSTRDLLGTGSVDVYPYNNEYAFANRLNYVHRPLFQNYMTLTPALDQRNARFFASTSRPRFVLWTRGFTGCLAACNPFDDFDQKYTLNEDPLTTTAILRNYRVVQTTTSVNGAPLAVLEASQSHSMPSRVPLKRQTMTFGTWYDVPTWTAAQSLVKVSPSFRLSPYGLLKSTLFRGGIIDVRYRLVSGEVRTYRLNTLNAGSGVLASPLLDDLSFTGRRVASISFVTPTPRVWHETFAGEWFAVPDVAASADAAFPPAELIRLPGLESAPTRSCDGSIDGVADASGRLGTPRAFTTSGTLAIRGWLAFSAPDGVPFDTQYLILTPPGQPPRALRPGIEAREDLVQVFHHAELLSAGFEQTFSLVPGRYALGLAGIHHGQIYRCNGFNVQISVS